MIKEYKEKLTEREFLEVTSSNGMIEQIQINLTNICNSRCIFCFQGNDHKNIDDELTLDEIKKLLLDVKPLGVKTIGYMGGEIFMRKDIIDILKLTRKLGYGCSIITNGQLLTQDIIYKIKDLKLTSVNVSVHSLNPDNYSFIYGNRNVLLDKVIENIKRMIDSNINVGIATTVTKYNLNELPQMLNYLKSLGVNQNNIAFNILFPCENYNDLIVTPEKFEKFIKLNPSVLNNFSNAPSTSEGRSILCQIGKKVATIDYNGDIKLCGLMDLSIGNIRNDTFYNI